MKQGGMISVTLGDVRFNYRVGGVCICDEHVLAVCYDGDESIWTLPGGRVETLETSAEALGRELHEELGVPVTVGRLLWVTENFFRLAGYPQFHELAFYYEAILPTDCAWRNTTRQFEGLDGTTRLTFRWVPLAALETFPLRPAFLRQHLTRLPASTTHIVHRDE